LEVREIEVPPEVFDVQAGQSSRIGSDRFKEYLRREFGFTPGLILILHIDEPAGDYNVSDSSHPEYFGRADDPEVRPEEEEDNDYAMGCAHASTYWLKSGAYTIAEGKAAMVME